MHTNKYVHDYNIYIHMTCNNCAYFCFIYALMYIQMIPARGPKQMLVKSRQVASTRVDNMYMCLE